MADESVVASETATADKVSFTPMEAAAKLREIREAPEAPEDAVAAEEAETPEPVETPEPAKEEAEDGEFEPDWSELADTSDDIDASDDSPGPDFSLTLKRKGEEKQVTGEEATRLAQMGLDYDLRMNEFNGERRDFEAFQTNAKEAHDRELAEVRKTREALAERLAKFTDSLTPPDPGLAETDPDAYIAQRAKYDASVLEAEMAAKDLDRQNQEERQKRETRVDAAMQAHMQRLNARIPATKEQATMDKVGSYMVKGMGFTRDDLVVNQRIHPADSRLLEMAFKAMKYDEQRLKAKKMRAKPGKTTSTGHAGRTAGPKDSVKEAVAKAKKTGKRSDAVEALVALREAS